MRMIAYGEAGDREVNGREERAGRWVIHLGYNWISLASWGGVTFLLYEVGRLAKGDQNDVEVTGFIGRVCMVVFSSSPQLLPRVQDAQRRTKTPKQEQGKKRESTNYHIDY